MPTKRRAKRKRKVNTFTREEYRCLFHGFKFFDNDRGMDGRSLWKSESLRTEMAGAWQFLAPQVMREWLASKPHLGRVEGVGSRPAGWWVYEARERRRCLNAAHPFDDAVRIARVAELTAGGGLCESELNYLMYGAPAALIIPSDFTREYESQAEYIDRLGLWLPGERELYEAAPHHDDHRPNHPPTSIGGAS